MGLETFELTDDFDLPEPVRDANPGGPASERYPRAMHSPLCCGSWVAEKSTAKGTRSPERTSWSRLELIVAVLVAIVLIAPSTLGVWQFVRLDGSTTASDLDAIGKLLQGSTWQLLLFFALVIFRSEIPKLLSRLEEFTWPGGRTRFSRQVDLAAEEQARKATEAPRTHLESPPPAPEAEELSATTAGDGDQPGDSTEDAEAPSGR
jgi:hypothetical protein